MTSRSFHTLVQLPGGPGAEVTFYCSDIRLTANEKIKFTELYIQFHDCIGVHKISHAVSTKKHLLETVVHNKVISARWHLC